MIIFLGLVVAAAALGVGVSVVLNNSTTAQLTLLDHAVPGITSMWQVFAAGVVLAVVFMGGLIVTAMGIGRAMRVRRELRDLRDEHEESLTNLEMEKRHLQRELARVRREQGGPGGPAPAAPIAQASPARTQTQAPQSQPQPQPRAQVTAPGQRPGSPGSRVSTSPFFDSAG